MPPERLLVIIIGGGPVGLTAAHALQLAGIDFIILEQRSTVFTDDGASLVLNAASLRVMHQLGILSTLLGIGAELDQTKTFAIDGYNFAQGSFHYVRRNHGTGPVAFHRAELVQALYQTLTEEARSSILYNKKVAEIFSGDEGVQVRCTDNTTYKGSILLGADGVHSVTRHWMRNLALKSDKLLDWDAEEPFESAYRCLWCSFPRPTGPGDAFNTQTRDRSVMYLTGRERGWIFIFEKLPQPTKKRVHYKECDILAVADSFADFPITESLKVRDVFSRRMTSGMANLEEGIVKHWSWGRIVLVGDACHKYTPNSAFGFQGGIQDVVALCNSLQSTVSAHQKEEMTTQDFAKVFERYHEERCKTVLREASISAHTTRLHAWGTTALFILARYIIPLRITTYILFNWVVARRTREALVLNYVAADEPFTGLVKWRHGLSPVSKRDV